MKIKIQKKLRLDEVIKHIYDNNITDRQFMREGTSAYVFANWNGNVKVVNGNSCILKEDRYIVEVEEELTIDTDISEIDLEAVIYISPTKTYCITSWHRKDGNGRTMKKLLRDHDIRTLYQIDKEGNRIMIWDIERGFSEERGEEE